MQAKLSTTDDVTWKEREAAVLALGAVAEGCINGLHPHLSEVISVIFISLIGPTATTCRVIWMDTCLNQLRFWFLCLFSFMTLLP